MSRSKSYGPPNTKPTQIESLLVIAISLRSVNIISCSYRMSAYPCHDSSMVFRLITTNQYEQSGTGGHAWTAYIDPFQWQ